MNNEVSNKVELIIKATMRLFSRTVIALVAVQKNAFRKAEGELF